MSARQAALANLRALLGVGRELDLAAVGAVARVASGDAEDAASARLIDEAEALLDAARGSRFRDEPAPASTALTRWLADPRGPFSDAVAELERLGAIASALGVVAPESAALASASARVASVSTAITEAARTKGVLMIDAAIHACARIADAGVDPQGDGALIALADVLGSRLEAALSGASLDAPAAIRASMLDTTHASELGRVLAKALGRATLDVSPDLLELTMPLRGPSSAREVVLHGVEAVEPFVAPVEILRGVHVTVAQGELVADVTQRGSDPVMLVPLERGEPGTPCAARGGAKTSETVFTLNEISDRLDGYALVVGDRIAFLRVR